MAVDFTEDYEGAADETVMTSGNSNFLVFSGSPTIDTAQAMVGTRSGRYASAGSITSTARTFTARNLIYDRVYIFVAGSPGTAMFFMGCNSGATIRAQNRINTDRTIGVRNATTLVYTFTTVLATNTWYRVERLIDLSAGTQETRLFLGHGTTALETSGTVAAPSGVTADRVAYGNLTAVTGTTIWMDDATSNNGVTDNWPGPSVSGTAVTAQAAAGVASTVAAAKVAAVTCMSAVGAAAVLTAQKSAGASTYAPLGSASSTTAQKAAPAVSRAAAGVVGAATAVGHRVTASTAGVVGVAARSTAAKVTAASARSPVGLLSSFLLSQGRLVITRTGLGAVSAAVARKATPAAAVGAVAVVGRVSAVGKRSIPTVRSAVGIHSRVTASKTLPAGVVGVLGATNAPTVRKRANQTARGALGVSTAAAAGSRRTAAGRSPVGLMSWNVFGPQATLGGTLTIIFRREPTVVLEDRLEPTVTGRDR